MTCCCIEEGSYSSGLQETLSSLPKIGWYYGHITVPEAERILRDEPNGSFIVRDTPPDPQRGTRSNTTDLFTITFKLRGRCGSIRVDYSKGYFTLSLSDPGLPLFRTMMDLVGYCTNRSAVQKKPVCVLTGQQETQTHNLYLYLTKPVNRHTRVHTLQHSCRQALHRYLTLDKMSSLPLPKHLLEGYMIQNPLYDANIYSNDTDDDSKSQISTNSSSTVSTDNELDTER